MRRHIIFPGLVAMAMLAFAVDGVRAQVRVVDPEPGGYVSGEYEIQLAADQPELIQETRFYIDGRLVSSGKGWIAGLLYDFGEAIEAHTIHAEVIEKNGGRQESERVTTRALRVDYEETTRLILLSAVVKTRANKPLTGLDADDFEVLHNGRALPIESFHKEALPLDLVLLLDTSSSLRNEGFPELKQSSIQFLNELTRSDQVLLFEFKNEPHRLLGFTTDRKRLVQQINELKPSGATALFDALLLGLDSLGSRRRGRKAVVLFTDGRDTRYEEPQRKAKLLRRAISQAQNQEVTVFTIGLGDKIHKQALETIAEETGGRYLFADKAIRLPQRFAELVEDLKNQYILGVRPPDSGSGFHALEIKVKKRRAVVYARKGYTSD